MRRRPSRFARSRLPLKAPLGKGEPGANCAAATTNDTLGGEENPRSLGVLITWGRTRILSMGDTTWNMENRLVCPRDLIGPVDLRGEACAVWMLCTAAPAQCLLQL